MELVQSHLESLCGSQLWDNTTVYSDNPDFTVCFQQTVLIWLPCTVLILISPLWIYMLTRQITSKLRFSWVFILKIVLTAVLMAIEVCNIYKAYTDISATLVFYVSPIVIILTYILAMILMNYERIRGLKTSSLLFTFWLLSVLTASIRLRSMIIHYLHDPEHDVIAFTIFIVYYTALALNTVISLVPLPSIVLEFNSETTQKLRVLPENQVSLISKLSFWWINNLILTGFKRDLTTEDLWRVEETESSHYNTVRFEYSWERAAQLYIRTVRANPEILENQSSKIKPSRPGSAPTDEEQINLNDTSINQPEVGFIGGVPKKLVKPSFGWALIKTFRGKFIAGSFLKFVYDIFQFVGPVILDKLIRFIKDKDQNLSVGLFYTVLLFVSSLIQSFVLQHYFHRMFIVGARVRTCIMNVVYKKSLKLSTSARKQATVGEMTNLVAVNAQTCADLTTYLNVLWSSPLQMTIAIYMLWQYLGVAAFIGVATMGFFIPLNLFLANVAKKLQTKKLKVQDSRIKMMNEILSGIKVLKFYGWELSFKDIVLKIRQNELGIFKQIGLLNVATSFTWTCAPLIVSIVSFASFVLIDENNVLDASTAFVSLSLFNILRFPMTVLPGIISALIDANVSLKRIRNFLLLDEVNELDVSYENIPGVAVRVKNADLGYDSSEAYFRDLNFEARKGELVAIVGEVGNGKSSLLYGILGEMQKLNNNGMINLNGTTAYVAQQAWIQNATLKDNILFGRIYNENVYNEVIQASCLAADLNIMPAGDMTEIGEKGINLSGGQKQRVSLARSLYANADIYFLDDPLSAVDSHVGKDLFDQVIGPNGLLKKKTRLFVTNSLSFLPQCDKVCMMKAGKIVEMGTYEKLLGKESGVFAEFIEKYLKDTQKQIAGKDDVEVDEKSPDSPKANKSPESVKTKQDEARRNVQVNKPVATGTATAGEKIIVNEKIESGKVKSSVFSTYFKACGYGFTLIAVLGFASASTTQIVSNLWLGDWSNDVKAASSNLTSTHSRTPVEQRNYRLGVYAGLGLIQCAVSLIADTFFLFLVLSGARALHNSMLHSVLRSTMEFFESTPSGRIINRFSKDVDATERGIPDSFKTLLRCFFQVLSTIVLISGSTPWFLVTLVPMVAIYILIQRYFVASMRQLKRMDSASKSPIFSHFSESLTGVSTIRAYKSQRRFTDTMAEKVDENLLFYFPNNISNRWLALRLELIGNMITVFAALFAVLARSSISAGIAGLSITYSLNVSQTLNWLVRMSADFETNITSAERIEEYCNTPHEAEWNSEDRPKESWPDRGHIKFDEYSVKYRKELDNVLNEINADIKPGEKIGIVGRTGAGKSSLSLGLFRILEYSTGRITIDGVDINTIGLHDLRHKLTIIPQDPVLFSGTLRMNLDPFGAYSDEKIWKSLEHAHLKQFVSGLDKGLEFECSEGGENLSVGQRQLICLARALLRKTKILLLDEATASVDHNTDELIQNTIRKEFADCTILTIAHRLNTIMDSSRILVLDKGRIVEFDPPQVLLSKKKSIFYSMAADAGIV